MRITGSCKPTLPKSLVSTSRTHPADLLCLQSQERADAAADAYHKELARRSLERGVFGGVLGAALLGGAYNLPHGFVVGPLFGAGVGVYTAWESMHRQKTGKVTVKLDDQVYHKPFYGHPSKVALSPQEAQFQLLAQGGHSASRVGPYNGKVAEPAAEAMAAWRDQAGSLRQLSEQRRLVASFGEKTEDGQAAVHLVDGLAAARLAARGGKVYAVNAETPKDAEHSLTMMGFNVAHSESNAEEYRYLERGVDYALVPLRTPADLAKVQGDAHGVPEGMFGLLEDSTHYSEVVNFGNQLASAETYSPEFGTKPTRHSDRTSHFQQKRLEDRNLNFESGLTTRHRVNLPALLGLAGTAAGMLAAMAFTGPAVPGPALMAATVGFLSGRAVGRLIID